MSDKRIFIVSEYIHSEQNSTGFYWASLIGRLANSFSVNVVSPKRPKTYTTYGIPHVQHTDVSYLDFHSRKVLPKVLSQLTMLFGFAYNIISKARQGDIIFSGTNPPLLLFCIACLKRIINFKWLVLVHDVFPENFVPAGVVKDGSIIYRCLFKIFNWAYSSADELVVIGRDMETLMREKTAGSVDISFIPNWVNAGQIRPCEKEHNKYVKKLGWQNQIVFYFFGNLGRLQGIDNLLEAISKVTHPKASFLFLGGGPLEQRVQDKLRDSKNLSAAYLGEVSLDDRVEGLNAGDIALISLDSGMLGLGVPSKSYFSMAVDKPLLVIADSKSEISVMVREANIGWVCEPDSPSDLASLIDNICAQNGHLKLNSSREVLLEGFTEDICLSKYECLINRIFTKEKF